MLSQDDQSKDHQPSGTCQELITVLAAHWQIHCVTINKITPHTHKMHFSVFIMKSFRA